MSDGLVFSGVVVAWHGRYGFIECDADKKQHFVHYRDLQVEGEGYRALVVGQRVEFQVVSEGGRTHAANVCAPGGTFLPLNAPIGGGGYSTVQYGRGGSRGIGRGQGYRGGRAAGYPAGGRAHQAQAGRLVGVSTGTVVSWLGRFGFIGDDDNKKQHFVHFRDLQVEGDGYRALTVGQRVQFQVVEQGGRTHAETVVAEGGTPLPSRAPGSQ